MRKIYHALTLNLHRPPGNLQWLLNRNEWEAKKIIKAIELHLASALTSTCRCKRLRTA